jgi:hypothetical protein
MLLTCLLATAGPAVAEEKYDPVALANRVAPFVDETTVAVLHGDMSRLETGPFVSLAFKLLPDFWSDRGTDTTEAVAKVKGILASLAEAGSRDVYVVINLRPAEYPVLLIVPLAEASEEPAVNAILEKGSWIEAARFEGAFFAGDPRTRERLAAHRPAPRAELVEAFEAVGDTAGQMISLPPENLLGVAKQIWSMLPDKIDGAALKLIGSVKWKAHGLNLSPKKSLKVVVQAEDAPAAEALCRERDKFVRLFAEDTEWCALVPNFIEIAAWTTPQVQGDRLIVSIDQPSQVDALMDALEKLVGGLDKLLKGS